MVYASIQKHLASYIFFSSIKINIKGKWLIYMSCKGLTPTYHILCKLDRTFPFQILHSTISRFYARWMAVKTKKQFSTIPSKWTVLLCSKSIFCCQLNSNLILLWKKTKYVQPYHKVRVLIVLDPYPNHQLDVIACIHYTLTQTLKKKNCS